MRLSVFIALHAAQEQHDFRIIYISFTYHAFNRHILLNPVKKLHKCGIGLVVLRNTYPDNHIFLRPRKRLENFSSRFRCVVDMAHIHLSLIHIFGNEKARHNIYQLSAPEEISYASLLKTLEDAIGQNLPTRPVTIQNVYAQEIPLPFPLDQNDLFSGEKASKDFDFEYTAFTRGMRETFDVYKQVHRL